MSAVAIVIVTLLSAHGAYVLAPRKGRAAKWWVFASVLFGPLPLIPLALLPAKTVVAA